MKPPVTPTALSLFVLLLTNAACTTVPDPPLAEPVAATSCNVSGVSWAFGTGPTPETREELRLSTGAAVVRVVMAGEPFPEDYRPDRLTISINPQGAITGLACG